MKMIAEYSNDIAEFWDSFPNCRPADILYLFGYRGYIFFHENDLFKKMIQSDKTVMAYLSFETTRKYTIFTKECPVLFFRHVVGEISFPETYMEDSIYVYSGDIHRILNAFIKTADECISTGPRHKFIRIIMDHLYCVCRNDFKKMSLFAAKGLMPCTGNVDGFLTLSISPEVFLKYLFMICGKCNSTCIEIIQDAVKDKKFRHVLERLVPESWREFRNYCFDMININATNKNDE